MEDCIFCKIANREIPSNFIYEDEDFFALRDIKPQAKIHVLVITKKHIPSLAAVTSEEEELIGKMIILAPKIARSEGLESFRVVFNSGKDAGQEVDHLHMHILGGSKLGHIA